MCRELAFAFHDKREYLSPFVTESSLGYFSTTSHDVLEQRDHRVNVNHER